MKKPVGILKQPFQKIASHLIINWYVVVRPIYLLVIYINCLFRICRLWTH